jgi:hypothetical protein
MLISKLRLTELPWKLLGVEALLIVLSVLLALALDSWREEREHRELADRAVQSFVDEMVFNCHRILLTEEYHQAVVAGEQAPQGVQVGMLRNDAWEVVKISGASVWLDYDMIEQMSAISAAQGDHRTVIQAYLQAMTMLSLPEPISKDWHLPGERAVIKELLTIQQRLLAYYRELAARIETSDLVLVQGDEICQR